MIWFKYLKENGHFDAVNNPSPVKVENGYQIPYWSVLDYLEKIALSISKGENIELAQELIEIIKNVSDHPIDNYHTWYNFIKILSILPNDLIPKEVLDYIPVWVTGQFDTMLQTQEICKKLLPKFISEQATEADNEKAEKIFCHLFNLNRNPHTSLGDGHSTSQYSSPFYLYFLTNDLIEERLLQRAAQQVSKRPLIKLIDSINFLLRDVPVNAQETIGEISYTLELARNFDCLNIKVIKTDEDSHSVIAEKTVDNYLDYNHDQISDLLIKIYKTYEIPEEIIESLHKRLRFNLENDMISLFGYNGIKDLDDEKYSGFNEALNTFSILLKEWLTALALQENPENIEDIFQILSNKARYKLPFFIRMKLYIVSQNWGRLKKWFFELIKDSNGKNLFSDDTYKLELYYLLSSIAGKMLPEEVSLLNDILEQGPIPREYYNPDPDHWRHRWLDALKNQEEFQDKYKTLDDKVKIKKNYQEEGKIIVRVGNVSPFTKEEILEMSYDNLLDQIYNFKNYDSWEDPTVEGFAEQLCNSVEENPHHFTILLKYLNDIKYIYAYHILYGFSKAAKAKKVFDWKSVLEFILVYISSEKFLNGDLASTDNLQVNQAWIYGNIASLIMEGSDDDQGSYGNDLLQLVKKILLQIRNLTTSTWDGRIIEDYVTSAINSTSGRILQAIILYSLKYARQREYTPKWENDIEMLYTLSLDESQMEAFAFLSMYTPQFMFLNEDWLIAKLSDVKNHNEICQSAFMDGLAFIRPLSKKYYEIIKPLYSKYCTTKRTSTRRSRMFINHLVSYYLWEYEKYDSEALVIQLLDNQPSADIISNLIVILSRFSDESSLDSNCEIKILHLWSLINREIKRFTDKGDIQIISNIVFMNDLLTSLTDKNIYLVEDNLELSASQRNLYHFLDNLIKWSISSEPRLIAKLVRNIKFDSYFDKAKVRDLVEFLYSHDQGEIAFEISNRISIMGHDFLRDLYDKYKE
jgi:hypothetical protein